MARATTTQAGTADGSLAHDDTTARRARGIALIVGAIVIVALNPTSTTHLQPARSLD